MGISSEFFGELVAESKRRTYEAKRKIKKEVSFDLLVKLLKRHQSRFKRYVTRSPENKLHHPAFPAIYYYCHYHIGRVEGYNWFFEDRSGTVMVYRSKHLTPIPLIEILGCEVSESQIKTIIAYLDKTDLIQGTDKTVVVPPDFYVFEFTAQKRCWPGGSERGETIGMVPPFQAKNLKDAIGIMKLWPGHWFYNDISNVRVHTHESCLKLKNTLPKSAFREKWYADLSDYDYELTAE